MAVSNLVKIIWAISLVLVAHAAFSAYEHVSTTKRAALSVSSSATADDFANGMSDFDRVGVSGTQQAFLVSGLPLDIVLELLVGAVVHSLCSIVSVRGTLKAIKVREFARQVGWDDDDESDARERPGFLDIRRRRREFQVRKNVADAQERAKGLQ
ncbi:hypothetical protein PYCC9005_004049 [Savitreella phatthalungensis]